MRPMTRRERCRWCGGLITANVLDPAPGVRAHIATPEHQAMRASREVAA